MLSPPPPIPSFHRHQQDPSQDHSFVFLGIGIGMHGCIAVDHLWAFILRTDLRPTHPELTGFKYNCLLPRHLRRHFETLM